MPKPKTLFIQWEKYKSLFEVKITYKSVVIKTIERLLHTNPPKNRSLSSTVFGLREEAFIVAETQHFLISGMVNINPASGRQIFPRSMGWGSGGGLLDDDWYPEGLDANQAVITS